MNCGRLSSCSEIDEPGSKLEISLVVTDVTGVGATMPSVPLIRVPVIWISSTALPCCACAAVPVNRAAATERVNTLTLKCVVLHFMEFPLLGFDYQNICDDVKATDPIPGQPRGLIARKGLRSKERIV